MMPSADAARLVPAQRPNGLNGPVPQSPAASVITSGVLRWSVAR